MEEFCENCVSEVSQRFCYGCHIMLKDGKTVYSNFMPTKAALQAEDLAATDSQQLKQAISFIRKAAIKCEYTDDGSLVRSLGALQKQACV